MLPTHSGEDDSVDISQSTLASRGYWIDVNLGRWKGVCICSWGHFVNSSIDCLYAGSSLARRKWRQKRLMVKLELPSIQAPSTLPARSLPPSTLHPAGCRSLQAIVFTSVAIFVLVKDRRQTYWSAAARAQLLLLTRLPLHPILGPLPTSFIKSMASYYRRHRSRSRSRSPIPLLHLSNNWITCNHSSRARPARLLILGGREVAGRGQGHINQSSIVSFKTFQPAIFDKNKRKNLSELRILKLKS